MRYPVEYDRGGFLRFGAKPEFAKGKYHLGHDFNTESGENVYAIEEGVVVRSDDVVGFGSTIKEAGGLIEIHHRNRITAFYGHVKLLVKVGDIVKEGQIIGKILPFYGPGGESWPHLHFGIHEGRDLTTKHIGYSRAIGNWVDPYEFIKDKIGEEIDKRNG